VQVRERASSGVYAEVSNVMKTPPPHKEALESEKETEESRPYEEVEYDGVIMHVSRD
jgi:hypothetical protein